MFLPAHTFSTHFAFLVKSKRKKRKVKERIKNYSAIINNARKLILNVNIADVDKVKA